MISEFFRTMLQFFSEDLLINALANISSLASLVLTIFILSTIHKITRNYLFKARVPQHIINLERIRKEISELLNDYRSNEKTIREKVKILEAELEQLRKKIGRKEARRVNTLLKTMRDFSKMPANRELIDNIVLEIFYLSALLRDLLKDRQWES